MKNDMITKHGGSEKVLIVVVDLKSERKDWTSNDELLEMEELVKACGAKVVDSIICRVQKPTARNLIGDSKTADILAVCELHKIDLVIFSYELKGSQVRNLEEVLKTKTIDRNQLILDIFARHARSQEGKMQVELAQLEYLLPRLVGHGVELSRLGGGIGTLGPGETKLEMDRRRISDRIIRLKKELKLVVQNRQTARKKRFKKGVPSVSLVGYTNAGKSTLLNSLTDSDQKTQDGLFTTLDSLSRQMALPNHQKIVISDTVGFMHALPHNLIESFKATLEEVKDADLLLHVVDISHPNFRQMFEAVEDVLRQLEAIHKPTIMVFNKIDRLEDRIWLNDFVKNYEHAVCISAVSKEGIPLFLEKITDMLSGMFIEINVDIPIQRMDLVNLVHEEGEVLSIKYYNDKINIRAAVPSNIAGKFSNFK